MAAAKDILQSITTGDLEWANGDFKMDSRTISTKSILSKALKEVGNNIHYAVLEYQII